MVYHLEPAADIPEDEAQMIVDIQHADFVQRNLGAAPLQAELNDEAELEPRNELVPEDIFKGRAPLMHQVKCSLFSKLLLEARCDRFGALSSPGTK